MPPLSSEHEPIGFESFAQRREISTILRYLANLLKNEDADGRGMVLVLDDAHSYPVRTLQQLQQLTRLQAKGRPLLQIVLVGQLELERKMNLLPLWRLRRQLALRVSLPPLTLNESLAYLRHRLAAVMEEEGPAFAPDTLTLLAELGDGNPYRLNVLGHNALIRGYETQDRPISPESIEHILQHVGHDLKKSVHVAYPLLPFLRMTAVGMVAGGIAVLFLAGLLSFWRGHPPTVVSSVDVEPALASPFTEVAGQEVTMRGESIQQPQVVMHEKENPSFPVAPNPLPQQEPLREEERTQAQASVTASPETVQPEPQPVMVKVAPPTPSVTAKTNTSSQSPDKLRPQQTHSKSVTTTPRQKPKGPSPAKGENATNVAKVKVTTAPQQSAVAKRSSPAQKKLPQQPVVQQSQASGTNHDRLFDE